MIYLFIEVFFMLPVYTSSQILLPYSYICSILLVFCAIGFAAFTFHIIVAVLFLFLGIGYLLFLNDLRLQNSELHLAFIFLLMAIFVFTIFHLIRILYFRLQTEKMMSKDLASAKEKIINQEKLATLATFAAGTAHEINNPITYMYGNIEYLCQYVNTLYEVLKDQKLEATARKKTEEAIQDTHQILEDYRQGFQRVIHIVSNMKQVFKQKSDITDKVDLAGVIYSTIDYFQNEDHRNVHFVTSIEGPMHYKCSAGDFLSVFQVLIANAIDAFNTNGTIRIEGYKRDGNFSFLIEDDGKGMNDKVLQNIFKPFFTTKESPTHMGIGLTLCKTIIDQYGGSIRVESEELKYTKVHLQIPLH